MPMKVLQDEADVYLHMIHIMSVEPSLCIAWKLVSTDCGDVAVNGFVQALNLSVVVFGE